ncbi:extracellular solute-binding protein [Legionella sp. CNM-4043-24]|uniref:extracellular solute-binding protein n=1 Tax=Legionella sp. CNM-4043-24 TaxID=3421646 RepID=UPI00403A8F53
MNRLLRVLIPLFYSGCLAAQAHEIVMWHSLAGGLGSELKQLVNGFNQSQSNYVIKPVYKGEYTDSLTSFAAAFRAGKPPAMVQVSEVGTATMLSPAGIIKPVHELMREQGVSLPEQDFLPAIRHFYSKNGQLQAMPFNISVPLIFYNADALQHAGWRNRPFPQTWQEMESLAEALKNAGYACSYTSAYPAWIQIESFSALHGLPLVSAENKAVYNHPALVGHVQRLQSWQSGHFLEYGGRTSDATVLFTSGHCVMFSQSSGSYASMMKLVRFRLGVAALPLDASLQEARHNNVAGGAALWAVAGQSEETYRGIALFYTYLARPDVQWRWHQQTGYIPIGLNGVYKQATGYHAQPTLAVARLDLARAEVNPFNPYRIPLNQIRMINDQALEAVFSGIKSPGQALKDATARADFVLNRFLRNVGES